MTLYNHFEAELIAAGEAPLSNALDRQRIEQVLLGEWASGRNDTIAAIRTGTKSQTDT
jgi:hypothetical protein